MFRNIDTLGTARCRRHMDRFSVHAAATHQSWILHIACQLLVASLLLVAMPGAPSSFLFLVAMPGAISSILAPIKLEKDSHKTRGLQAALPEWMFID